MGDSELKQLPSLLGYLNIEELQKVLLQSIGAGSLSAFVLAIFVAILENMDKVYIGPSGALVISLCSALAAVLRGRAVGRKMLRLGERTH